MFADGHLKFCFSFTRDSYESFLLRHGSFSYINLLRESGRFFQQGMTERKQRAKESMRHKERVLKEECA